MRTLKTQQKVLNSYFLNTNKINGDEINNEIHQVLSYLF